MTACVALANIVKSSLGPEGLDKMLVDQIGDVTITNDGATILKKLEVEHPAARVLVELAQHQDEEVGDGTTSVVILAAELLKVRLISNLFYAFPSLKSSRVAFARQQVQIQFALPSTAQHSLLCATCCQSSCALGRTPSTCHFYSHMTDLPCPRCATMPSFLSLTLASDLASFVNV